MNFPTTRFTLIHRLAHESNEHDWSAFIDEYWRPVCRFAAVQGHVSAVDAEDVAADMFEVLISKNMLRKWVDNQQARLSTLLCAILRRILSNRSRSADQRAVKLQWQLEDVQAAVAGLVKNEQREFERLWVDEIVYRSLDTLRDQYLEEGRGDYFRTLYGRVCEGMSHQEVADYLGVDKATALAWFKHAKMRLSEAMRQQTRAVVRSYARSTSFEAEFEREWRELGEWLRELGGLDEAIRLCCSGMESSE